MPSTSSTDQPSRGVTEGEIHVVMPLVTPQQHDVGGVLGQQPLPVLGHHGGVEQIGVRRDVAPGQEHGVVAGPHTADVDHHAEVVEHVLHEDVVDDERVVARQGEAEVLDHQGGEGDRLGQAPTNEGVVGRPEVLGAGRVEVQHRRVDHGAAVVAHRLQEEDRVGEAVEGGRGAPVPGRTDGVGHRSSCVVRERPVAAPGGLVLLVIPR